MPDIHNNYSTNNTIQEVTSSKEVTIKVTLFDRLYRFFFGDDIFISHSRIDGIDYARSLARLLQKKYQLRCFADFYWTEIGEKLPSFLVRKLKRSSVLVVAITEGADKRPENIKEEIEIFKKTRRPILVVNLDNKYQKNNWTELQGINVIKGFSEEQTLHDAKNKSLLPVLKSIKESFNYKTKYDQQRRSAFITFTLLILSLITVIGAAVYANRMIVLAKTATREKNTAIAERDNANIERGIAIGEKNRINQELAGIQDKLDEAQRELNTTQKTLRDKEVDLTRARADLRETGEEKRKAETEAKLAKEEEVKARERSEELDIRSLGTQASILSATEDQKFAALKLAVEGVEKSLEMNNHSFEALPGEVRKGIIDAVVEMNFARPLKNDIGEVSFTTISPDGKLIFGSIHDQENKRKYRRVIWETAKPNEYHLLKEEFSRSGNIVEDVAFSGDGRWLFVPYTSSDEHLIKIEMWEVTQENGNYNFTSTAKVELPNNERFYKIASNRDGTQIAIMVDKFPGKIKIINRKGLYFNIGDYVSSPIDAESMAFSPQDELILADSYSYEFYNATKRESFRRKGEINGESYRLEDITDSGDFILKKRGLYFFKPFSSKYILIDSQNRSFISSWEKTNPTDELVFSGIGSLTLINGRAIEVSYISNRLCLIDHFWWPNSFKYDFKEIHDFEREENLILHSLEDNSSIGISSGRNAGIIDQQTGIWNQINISGKNVNTISWLERTDEYLYLGYNEGNQYRVHDTARLQITNLKENKTIQCKVSGHIEENKFFLFHEKYPVILQDFYEPDKGSNKQIRYFLSIYDPNDCQELVKLELLIPDHPVKMNDSKYDHLDIRDLYLDRNNILRGSLMHIQHNKNSIARNVFLIMWDLNNIKLTSGLTDDKKIKLSANIYALPFDPDKVKSYILSSVTARTLMGMTDTENRHFLFEFKDYKWDKKELELNAAEQNNPLGYWTIFSNSGDLVAQMVGLTVRIWDTNTGKRKLTLNLPKDVIEGDRSVLSSAMELRNEALGFRVSQLLVFSPDERSIGITTKDKQINFYPTSIEGYYYLAKEILK
jgi:Skp family chaperone for outer membrane proteins